MAVIYPDEIFLLNFLTDYILLLMTARISGAQTSRLKLSLSAAFGALYAVLAEILNNGFIHSIAVKVFVAGIMVLISFGTEKNILRLGLLFFAVSAAFAGAVMAIALLSPSGEIYGTVTYKTLFIIFVFFWVLFSVSFGHMAKHSVNGEILDVTITSEKKSITVKALCDTGNSLTDPITGAPVTICGLGALSGIFDPAVAAVITEYCDDPIVALDKISGIDGAIKMRLLPYSALGNPGAMLLAFRPDSVTINGRVIQHGMVAIAPQSIFCMRGYSALTGSA